MTPQQANELLNCPLCCGKAEIQTHGYRAIECSECGANVGAVDLERGIEMWNRRAPAPTEPAVDRDAVLEEVATFFEQPFFDQGKIAFVVSEIRALKLATPALPAAVCAPNCFYGDCPPCVEAGIAPQVAQPSGNTGELPQVAQASQPTSAEGDQ